MGISHKHGLLICSSYSKPMIPVSAKQRIDILMIFSYEYFVAESHKLYRVIYVRPSEHWYLYTVQYGIWKNVIH